MTTPPNSYRRRGLTLLAAVILAGAVTASTTGPAFADPSPVPSAPSAPGAPAGGASTGAPDSITWAVQPSTKDGPDQRSAFTYNNISSGTIINDYVGVTNFSQKTVTFEVYASDAFNTTTGSLDLLAASEQPKDVGSWVAIPKKTVTLNPGERVNEPFTLTVPPNATPGDHVGGLIASVHLEASDGGSGNVQVDRRLAVPIYLRVSGDIKSGLAVESISTTYHGTFNPFTGGDADVSYTLRNTGNARLDLTHDVTVEGLFGLHLGTAKVPPVKDLLPGATYRVTQRVSGVFPLGPLTASVQVHPTEPAGLPPSGANPQAASGDAGLWATPWPQLALLVLLAAIIAAVVFWLRRGRERTQRKVAKAVAKARRDTVEELTGGPDPTAVSAT